MAGMINVGEKGNTVRRTNCSLTCPCGHSSCSKVGRKKLRTHCNFVRPHRKQRRSPLSARELAKAHQSSESSVSRCTTYTSDSCRKQTRDSASLGEPTQTSTDYQLYTTAGPGRGNNLTIQRQPGNVCASDI